MRAVAGGTRKPCKRAKFSPSTEPNGSPEGKCRRSVPPTAAERYFQPDRPIVHPRSFLLSGIRGRLLYRRNRRAHAVFCRNGHIGCRSYSEADIRRSKNDCQHFISCDTKYNALTPLLFPFRRPHARFPFPFCPPRPRRFGAEKEERALSRRPEPLTATDAPSHKKPPRKCPRERYATPSICLPPHATGFCGENKANCGAKHMSAAA